MPISQLLSINTAVINISAIVAIVGWGFLEVFVIRIAWVNKIGPKTEAKHISQTSTNFGQL